MRVERINPKTNKLLAGTVIDIPFPLDPSSDTSILNYTILFDDGSTASIPLEQMAGIIPPPPINVDDSDSTASLLPPFLRLNSKITFEHESQYHKGFLRQCNEIYSFVFKSHVNKRKEDWSVPLPNLLTTWMDLCVEGVLLPSHISHTFLCSPTSPQLLTFDPVASFVSALNLHKEYPPTLLKALADSHPDREVWLQSYEEEKSGLESLDTYHKLTLGKYQALCKKGAPCTISTMHVLTINWDETLPPQHAKSRIVVLGNHDDRVWSKLDKFGPVLWGDPLRFLVSMAVQLRQSFCQGDCKNVFCQRNPLS